ncbi:MAG: ABC transporter permease [Planctomycetota bacterium]|jgi:ABC-type transport system involved in multi-copper enzyme maturation permease subunit
MFEQIFTIARNTFTESIRQPIFVVLLIACMLLLILNPAISAYTLGDDDKLLLDMGLSTIFLGGLFLAAFTATGVLSREIDNKTVLTVISKPIGRPTFVIGKYIGVIGAITVAFWIWSALFLLTIRHRVMSTAADHLDMPVIVFGSVAVLGSILIAVWGNYFYNWVFNSRFSAVLLVMITLAYMMVLMVDKKWQFQSITTELNQGVGQMWQLLIALGLVLEALAVITAIAIACSTRLGQLMTLAICLAVFLVGLSSDYMFGRYTESMPLAWVPYALAPNMQYHWLADALTQRNAVDVNYIMMISGYSVLYTTAILSMAIGLFQTRETG